MRNEFDVKQGLVNKILLAGLAMFLIMSGGLYRYNSQWSIIDEKQYNVQKLQETDLRYRINENLSKQDIQLDGFIYKKGEAVRKSATWIVLKDLDNERYYKIPTDTVERKDITKYEADKKHYDGSGFQTKIRRELLQQDVSYHVYLLYSNNKNSLLLDTGRTVSK